MIRLYPLLILVQIFCLYHAYTNKSEQKWFWIITFLPLVGSIIYLYDQFYNRRNIENIKEGVKETLIENYTINKLERKVNFSDTHSNKMELATEHLKVGNYNRALEIFKECSKGSYVTDSYLNMKLLKANYLTKEYEEVVKYGSQLIGVKEFKNSEEMTAYAWATYKVGNVEKAESLFLQMDISYSNYENRLEYAYFLQETGRRD